MRSFLKNEDGHTLLETIVALFLLTSITIPLLFFINRISFSTHFKNKNVVYNYCQNLIENRALNNQDTVVFIKNYAIYYSVEKINEYEVKKILVEDTLKNVIELNITSIGVLNDQ